MNDAASGRSESDSRTRILASARTEIERRGILGLRVADVARGAGTSITLIYRHFKDRDGLLAAVQWGIEKIREQSGEHNPLDPRIYALMLLMFNTMFVNNDALRDLRITEPEYREFLRHFFARYDVPA